MVDTKKVIRAEFFRLSRDPTFGALLLAALALSVLAAVGAATTMPSVPTINQQRTADVVTLGFGGSLFSMIFGALSVSRDFSSGVIGRVRFQTRGPTALVCVRALVVLPAMLVFGLLCTGSTLIVARLGLPDRKSTRLNSSHMAISRMPSSA
jgi:hypothetical protein